MDHGRWTTQGFSLSSVLSRPPPSHPYIPLIYSPAPRLTMSGARAAASRFDPF